MRLSNDSPELGRNRRVKFIDSIGFRRPVDLIGYRIPAETAGVAHGLRLVQVGLAAPKSLFGSPTIAVLLPQVRIEVGVLQRNRGLGGEQLQYRASRGREHAGGQVILEVEHADQCGLLDQGQTENGTEAILANVLIAGKRALRRGIVQNHTLVCPYDVVK